VQRLYQGRHCARVACIGLGGKAVGQGRRHSPEIRLPPSHFFDQGCRFFDKRCRAERIGHINIGSGIADR
jgi:hypothetical protein